MSTMELHSPRIGFTLESVLLLYFMILQIKFIAPRYVPIFMDLMIVRMRDVLWQINLILRAGTILFIGKRELEMVILGSSILFICGVGPKHPLHYIILPGGIILSRMNVVPSQVSKHQLVLLVTNF